MQPGDRLVCLFLQVYRVGDTFQQWPLHVTIVPWFRMPDSSAQLGSGLGRALGSLQPFTVVAADEARFGPRRRLVRLLEPSGQLVTLEHKVRTYLHKKRAWLVDETTKRRYDFRPHVTAQAEQGLAPGATVLTDRLYIVEQKGDYKEIVSEVCFGKTTA
jgi:2'-5' RNA ligase